MKLKLNVYENKKIVKTCVAESYDLMFGTVEDLVYAIDFDSIKEGNDAELIKAIAKAVPKTFKMIKPLLKDIFEDLTDDDLKHVRVLDIAKVLVNVVKFSFGQISEGVSGKN